MNLILFNSLFIFVLRVTDVTLGTIRTVLIMRNMRVSAALVGFVEITIWVVAITKVVSALNHWVYILSYSGGFAAGTLCGLTVVNGLSLGYVNIKIISSTKGPALAAAVREAGYGATLVEAEGKSGTVFILNIVTARRHLPRILEMSNKLDPKAFVTIEEAPKDRMRPPLIAGILAERKYAWERRAPLVPEHVAWLRRRGIEVEVESSVARIFPDAAYKKAGGRLVDRLQRASLILGIKEPEKRALLPNRIYCVFSHTAKGQAYNRPLLKAFLEKKITLVDYEYIRDRGGTRTVFFGRFAGICGMVDALHLAGHRMQARGVKTVLTSVRNCLQYGNWEKAKEHLRGTAQLIRKNGGLSEAVSPFVIGITGHGNVSQGAQEVLDIFRPLEIHPRDLADFMQQKKGRRGGIYKCVFTREEKFRARDGGGFYFEEYLRHPERFESNLGRYLPYLTLLVHASYWDARYPRLVTKPMIRDLCAQPENRLTLIADLTCDLEGAIEITKRVTTPKHPLFVYDSESGRLRDDPSSDGVAVMAVDNLPSEFPADASGEFSAMIRDHVYQMASHGITDITRHHALPVEIRNAVLCQEGRLTRPFQYLRQYLTS